MNKALIVEMVDSANKRCRRVSVLILFVAIAGCYVADRPLTPAGTKAPDGRLLGQWRCVSGSPGDPSDKPLAILKVRALDAARFDAEMGAPGENPDVYRVHESSVAGHTLLSVQEVRDGEPNDKSWIFARTQFLRADIFELAIMDDELVKDLKDGEAVRTAVASNFADPRLFFELCVCVKIRDRD